MYYHRKLPHYLPDNSSLFITYRLTGSIPMEVINRFKQEYIYEQDLLKKQVHLYEEYTSKLYDVQKRHFARTDNFLDTNLNHPYWLSNEAIAKTVYDSLLYFKDEICIDAFCIMSNHVHVVLKEIKSASIVKFLKRHKNYTAHEGNRVLGRTGQFWERESYDHVIRNEQEWKNIILYTLNNPVKVNFIKHWKEWKWNWVRDEVLLHLKNELR